VQEVVRLVGNRNTLYAEVLMEELARAGLRHICLSPGSRNTPLVIASARNEVLVATSHLDERSAAFFALGAAIATDSPVALVCTSGSAAANYFPAIVEAHAARVPLIVITADRPHELRYSGANQTIDQVKLFGEYALWSVDLALPEALPSALAIRNLRATANRAYSIASGAMGPKGVVHLNVPLRAPLEPTDVPTDAQVSPNGALARDDGAPFARFAPAAGRMLSVPAVEEIAALIADHPRGLIVCGPRSPRTASAAISQLANHTGYPLLTDAVSGLRFGLAGPGHALGGYDSFLALKHPLLAPDLVIRVGAVPTSKWLNQYLDAASPTRVIQLSDDGVWADDTHRTRHFIHADAVRLAEALMQTLQPRDGGTWCASFARCEQLTWQVTGEALTSGPFFDGGVVHDIVTMLPDGAMLLAGNSLPVRHLDQFGPPGTKRLFAHANRGASGIDGNVSTVMGLGYARAGQPVVGVVGDVTLYHDMNGLLAAHRCGVPVILVVLNNNGGGIFHRLPVRDFEPEFTDYFLTPHGLDFAHAARLYGFDYTCVEHRDAFGAAFASALTTQKPSMIEVRTDAKADLAARSKFMVALQAALAAALPTS